MLKHLPRGISAMEVLEVLATRGFGETIDFFYLPLDFADQRNLGYAFVNFTQHEVAVQCMRTFQDFSEWSLASKPCRVQWSHPHQGLEAHVERYRNSTVMHYSVPDQFKPMVFHQGMRVPYPAPTTLVRPPRARLNRSVNGKGDYSSCRGNRSRP